MQSLFHKLAFCFAWLTALTLTLTVSLIPWILGGVVPAAAFTLLAGSTLAALFSTLFQVFSANDGNNLPKLLTPLLGLAIIGFWQLTSAAEPVGTILSDQFETYSGPSSESATSTRSFSPADTRTKTAIYLSLALISVSAFQTMRTPGKIAFVGVTMILNGLTVGIVGLLLQFQGQPFPWNELWELGRTKTTSARGLAAFINPNNAGGWLCLTFATAAGWVHWQLQKKSTDPKLRRGRLRISWFGRSWQNTLEFLAELTVWQILSLAAVAFLGAVVAATKSRGAIGALAGAIVLTAAMRSSFRMLPFVLAFIMATGGASYVFLQSLDLSEDIAAELDTMRDIETAVGVRPQHWWDAMRAWIRFPILGAGHGSYRFATIPFSTSYHRTWFRNADNQYVETLVEAGVVGLTFLLSIGWIGLKSSSAATKQGKTRNKERDRNLSRPSRRILTALGTAITIAILTQGIAATTDFGVAMPAAISLLILMISSLAGYLNTSPDSEPTKLAGTISCSKKFSVSISLMLLAATIGFLNDQWKAVKVDQQVVASHRILLAPASTVKLEQIKELKASLTAALVGRPDDPEGLRMLSRLVTANFRWETLLVATDGAIVFEEKLPLEWNQWNLLNITCNLQQVAKDHLVEAQELRSWLIKLMESQRTQETLRSIQLRFPHLLGLPFQRAMFASIVGNREEFERQAMLSQALDPSNAEKLFGLGIVATKLQLSDKATEFWKESLKLSNEFRWAILSEAAKLTNASQAVTDFGPESYEDCLGNIQRIRTPDLKEAVWRRAEELWQGIKLPASELDCQLRLRHLKSTNRSDEVFAWLESTLRDHPRSIPLLVEYAQQLEGKELFRKAFDEWQRVLYLDPENRTARKSISRLSSMK